MAIRVITEKPDENCIFIDQQSCNGFFKGSRHCNEWHKQNAYSQLSNTIQLIDTNVSKIGGRDFNIYADYYNCMRSDSHSLSQKSKTTIQSRLKKLNQLYENGLIDKETFKSQQKIILDEI